VPVATVQRVVVIRTSSVLGERVMARFDVRGGDVVTLDRDAPDMKARLAGVDVVVDLGADRPLAALLDAASAAAVPTLVVVSSATVYGAWPDNAVPLTEDITLRPNPGFAYAARASERERLAAEWADENPTSRVALLRLAPVLSPTGETWLSSTLARPSLVRPADSLPPVQVLHVEDAASAVVHAAEHRLDGVFNVAPDGSASGETARALSAAGVPVGLPDWLATRAERWANRLRLGGTPRAAEPYRLHPWIVANDRLRATDWSPAYTSEETIVACRHGSRWRELSPQRRQEIALGASGGIAAIAATAITFALRASRSRRRDR
jgi:hypothetical protein